MARKSANKADYLTVNELSQKVNRSIQSIYKRMRPGNSLWKYVREIDGIKMVHKNALREIYGVMVDGDDVHVFASAEELPPETPEEKMIRFLQRQIQEKDEQLRRKDEQIDNLMNTQAVLHNKLLALMDKSQSSEDGQTVDVKQTVEPSESFTQTFTQEGPETVSEPPKTAEGALSHGKSAEPVRVTSEKLGAVDPFMDGQDKKIPLWARLFSRLLK